MRAETARLDLVQQSRVVIFAWRGCRALTVKSVVRNRNLSVKALQPPHAKRITGFGPRATKRCDSGSLRCLRRTSSYHGTNSEDTLHATWRMQCGECSVENAVWRMQCGDAVWRMRVENVVWRMQCGECSVENAVWRMQCGECSVENTVWRMQCGECSVGMGCTKIEAYRYCKLTRPLNEGGMGPETWLSPTPLPHRKSDRQRVTQAAALQG